jgi:hypothetical protein
LLGLAGGLHGDGCLLTAILLLAVESSRNRTAI